LRLMQAAVDRRVAWPSPDCPMVSNESLMPRSRFPLKARPGLTLSPPPPIHEDTSNHILWFSCMESNSLASATHTGGSA
jgi:hypothetical protein